MTGFLVPTYLGRWNGNPVLIDMHRPDLSTVPWALMCRSLCAMNRFNGCTNPLISVAGHSVRVMRALPERLKVYGALHDMHEAIMGDQTRPFRDALALHGEAGTVPLESVENGLQAAVFAKARVSWPLSRDDMAILDAADSDAGRLELEQDMAGTLGQRFGDDTLTPHPSEFTKLVESAIALHHMRAAQALEAKAQQLEGAL